MLALSLAGARPQVAACWPRTSARPAGRLRLSLASTRLSATGTKKIELVDTSHDGFDEDDEDEEDDEDGEEDRESWPDFMASYPVGKPDVLLEGDEIYMDGEPEPEAPASDFVVDINLPPVMNQGQLNSCTANATSVALRHCLRFEGEEDFQPSRMFLWYHARKLKGNETKNLGSWYRTTLKGIETFGCPREEDWPYDPAKLGVEPPPEVYDKAGKWSFSFLNVPKKLNYVAACLAEGYPLLFVLQLHKSFGTTGADGMVKWPATDEKTGIHSVLLKGMCMKRKLFKLRNSWGTKWGRKGDFYVPFDYLFNESSFSTAGSLGGSTLLFTVRSFEEDDD